MACNSCQRLGTPGQYVARAKRLVAQGHPGARKAALEAVVAVKAAEFARAGDKTRAARALQALRGLASATDTSRATTRPPLSTEQKTRLASKMEEVAQRRFAGADAAVRTVRDIATVVASIVSLIVNLAISDVGTRNDFNRVMGWIVAIIGGRSLPPLSDSDVTVFAAFCAVWSRISGAIGAAIDAAQAAGTSFNFGTGSASVDDSVVALVTVARAVTNTMNAWCNDPTIQAILTPAAPAAPPPATPTPISLQAQVRQAWQRALAARIAVEASLRVGQTAVFPRYDRAMALDCPTAQTLYTAERAMIDTFGAVPNYGSSVPGSSTARMYLQTPPPSSCPRPAGYEEDRGDTAGGGSGLVLAAGAAVVAALFLFR